MNEKDLSEKILFDYNDVFADIVNGLIFCGENRVKKDMLESVSVKSQYKADDGRIHEEERDVKKIWKDEKVRISVFGIENQSSVEKLMPLRVIGYDGANYRNQLLEIKSRNKTDANQEAIPVVTLVLYFGTDKRWTTPQNIKGLLNIPKGLEEYVNDYKINVFEIGWLTDEQIERFHSDFKIVANFFAKKQRNKDYVPDDKTEIQHVDEVLKLLSVMTGEHRYEKLLDDKNGKEVHNMCEVYDRAERRGIEQGIQQALTKDIDIIMAVRKGRAVNEIAKTMEIPVDTVQRIADAMTAKLS